MSKRDLVKRAKDAGVRIVRLQFNDIHGVTKNVAIPIGELDTALEGTIAFDGSCIEGFVRHEESDMYLAPDPATFALLPLVAGQPVEARLLCDVHDPDGSTFEGCTRSTLRRMVEEAARDGFVPEAGAELEFFLFEQSTDGRASTATSDRGSYFDLSPIDRGDAARCDVALALEDMGIRVEATHHEVSRGQHEIDLCPIGALALADAISTARVVVKTIAARHGLHATFMPKPFVNQDGSGLHVSQRLLHDERNVLSDPAGDNAAGLSEAGLAYVGGLLAHASGFTAVTNPTINSYKRLVPGYDAPSYILWSQRAKSALVRVPAAAGGEARIELRSPDPSCNPYLALACIITAGLDGIRRKLVPGDPIDINVAELTDDERAAMGVEQLPLSLYDAVQALDKDHVMRAAIGDHSYHRLREAQLAEWETYRTQVHPWELEAYLSL
ncbi:MAG: type I glutamate--ammonia ligase [Candidatus Eremiobacteraeota bacterium]|nr:type I glutamate--ammonia ligase [Candidatus Eremiobacteraeota bacterium]